MPSTAPDMNYFMDEIFATLEEGPKDEIMKDNFVNVFSDVWTPPDDLLELDLNTMNDLNTINELDTINDLNDMDLTNNLNFDNDLASPPSSDSGLSSALSLTGEEQLSPLLSFDDDANELSDKKFNPNELINYEPFCPSNESFGSIDSPIRSVMSSSMGSPETDDVTEEMDFEPNMVTIPDQTDIESSTDVQYVPIKQEISSVEIDTLSNPQEIIEQESVINVQNIQTTTVEELPPVTTRIITTTATPLSSLQSPEPETATSTTPATTPTVSSKTTTTSAAAAACNGKRIQQLIRVSGSLVSGNPRSLLLPVSLKDIKQFPGIKIISSAQAKNFKNFKINQGSFINKTTPITIKQEDTSSEKSGHSSDDISETETQYPRLKLNNEEKRLLEKEGITLPSHYPLTKTEERELKRIRRKIRNKISAQDSRKRKKEYVDGLEDRVKQCTEENMTLLKRIKALQTQNQSLAGQLKRLQALIQKGNKSAQPATCLMVLLLSLALVAAPNLNHRSNSSSNELSRDQEQPENMPPPINGRSRSLLFSKQLLDEDFHQYGEELLQEFEGLLDHDYNSPIAQMPVCKRPRYDNDQCNKYSASMDHVGGTLNKQSDIQNVKLSKKYIEPPLDDVWPPPKPNIAQPAKIVDKLEALTNELKINISDADGTRTVLVKVPQEQ